ncbi:DUF6527 family protein [Salinimicrobium xinjiangense]|uniref:DUF6527 family protein n=1 Tax=Salinimicrobium xinjiangense TaxID=438596 RepID=UPI00146D3628|nr:DUF6527 family protein [Salinimicrobium xinjiangense]
MFKGLFKKLRCVFGRNSSRRNDAKPPHFGSVVVSTKAPANDEIEERVLIQVKYQGKPYWCLFKCPCGCRRVISLSLQENHEPHWELKVTESGIPSLSPSVWQTVGCLSHFWIEEGFVRWCTNTGQKPWIAEPEYYSKPRKNL